MSNSNPKETAGLSRRQLLRGGASLALASVFGLAGQSASANSTRVIRHVSTSTRKVCITYDDLWSEYYALRIGREYYRRNVRLTFFPAGRAILNNLKRPNPGYENLYPRLRDMGHEFGCHLFTHRVIRDFSLQQLVDEEMAPALYEMRRALGSSFYPVGIRPPYGHVTDALKELSARYGMPLILWGLDSQDAVCTKKYEDKRCGCAAQSSFETYARVLGPSLEEVICSDEQCTEKCAETILHNYKTYLRPGTIILHHTLKSSLHAIQPTLGLLRAWNMQPVPLSELLRLAS